ncbi:MAG: Uncharacterized protein XD96_0718 [Petrotoga mobilis]|nr:MAG: Uncharacterized protein XD96_0718 [Petrotoga mobilis]
MKKLTEKNGNNNVEDKLRNLYKIKEEIEKELEKKGIRKPDTHQKKKTAKTIYKADYEIEKLAVSINNINNWFDLIIYDIDLSNEKLSHFFELRLSHKTLQEYSNQFGMMHLFRNDFQKAERFFESKNDINSKINQGFLKIIRNDEDANKYFTKLISTHPKNGLVYLTLSLLFLKRKDFYNAYKIIKVANSFLDYSFINMGLNAYEKNFQKALSFLSKAYLEGKAKRFVNLINYYVSLFISDSEKAFSSFALLKEDKTPCINCIKILSNSEKVEHPSYCPFYERILFHTGNPKPYKAENSELYEILFHKYYQEKDIQQFNSYAKKIEQYFNNVPLIFLSSTETTSKKVITDLFSQHKMGVKINLKGPNYYDNLNKVTTDLKTKYQRNFTFFLDLPFYEALRLLFGWRICQYLYR